MVRYVTHFIITALLIATNHGVVAQLLDSLEYFAEQHVLWDFVPPQQFFSVCMKVGNDVGERSADARVCESSCDKHVAQFKDPDAKLHCKYMAMQMEIATTLEMYHGPYEFCKNMLMYQSYNLQVDVLKYVTKRQLWEACTQSIVNAMDAGAGVGQTEAIQQNLPIGCKEAVENLYREHGMPIPSASIACKDFVRKAEMALSAQELSPSNQGKQFCDGNSMQAVAFAKSAPSEAPTDFPLSIEKELSDWKPKITLEQFKRMVREAFHTPIDAFTTYDADKDGNLNDKEWLKLGRDLGIPTLDILTLSGLMDEDQNSKSSKREWQKIFGVTLPELVEYSNAKHLNAENGWRAADKDGDGNISPEEFEAVCTELKLTPEDAQNLFPQVDLDGDGSINQEEYKNAFGIGIPEFKRRARKNFGVPVDSFKAVDANGDGKIQPEEFMKGCKDLDIPGDTAQTLYDKLDADENGGISPKEWDEALAMTPEDVKKAVAKKFGADPLSLDTNKDGKVSPEEVAAGLEKSGASPKEAAKLVKDMDEDGDGKVSPEEIHKGLGGADLDEARGFSHPSSVDATEAITLPEFMERAKTKHGTPQTAFDAFDLSPKDGKITPEEFASGCAKLKPPISADEAKPLFAKLDIKPADSVLSPEEFFGGIGGPQKFGLTLPEFNERAVKKSGEPTKAYKDMDQNGDGKVSPEEFDAYCENLLPPVSSEESAPLFNELDKNGSGFIDPPEFFDAVGKEAFSGGAGASGPGSVGVAPERGQIGDADGDGKISPAEKVAKTRALDLDGDGKVSPEEMGAAVDGGKLGPEEMKALDTDGDGKLSKDELQQGAAATSANAQDQKKVMDTNGDGKIDPEEVAQAAARGQLSPAEVKKMDIDGDGKLSPAELKRGAEAAETAAAAAGDANQGSSKTAAGGYRPRHLSPDKMKALDTDGDGKLSEHELRQGAAATPISAEVKKKMDTDGDGKLGPDEVAAAAARGQITPGQALNKMDADGDGKLSRAEFERGVQVATAAAEEKKKIKEALKGKFDSPNKATQPMDIDGNGMISRAEIKKGLKDQGWGSAEAQKVVKDLEKDGYWITWGEGYGDIDPWGHGHQHLNSLPHMTVPAEAPTVLVNSHRLPAMKWQEAKAFKDSKFVGEGMKKLLHDTASNAEAKGATKKFMSPKKHHHNADGHPSKEHQPTGIKTKNSTEHKSPVTRGSDEVVMAKDTGGAGRASRATIQKELLHLVGSAEAQKMLKDLEKDGFWTKTGS
eukprot:gnl/MRDRNA2_/MRDRNA2_60607_c0_seq1.p1 gnl/MRDRNA2_/MRDRNA2_60607_c0~~gnl/MRDRNA2_/MRDRNA2_60607_c0_seq1.p1  ORF type:complete len:1252 (+),score=372.78 gnl/MRDRNA2_/MRDRNA2_60607_c0_seq1:149-3904(+)